VVAVRIVSELCEHPGAEDDTESWQGEVDVGVRVLFKMGSQLGLEGSDLLVERSEDRDLGSGRRGEGPNGDRGCFERLDTQTFDDRHCSGVDVAGPSAGA